MPIIANRKKKSIISVLRLPKAGRDSRSVSKIIYSFSTFLIILSTLMIRSILTRVTCMPRSMPKPE